MNYREALVYLLSFADFERSGRFAERPDVRPMAHLLTRLGNPQLGRTTVHIAGSKGKGSVAAMMESVLRHAGLRTGLFTSPHLHSFCERIRINGQPLGEEEFAGLAEAVRPAAAAVAAASEHRQFVTFDLLTAMAFLAFRQQQVEVQVIEVGLGGRLDSTNVFAQKEGCVITPISLEHTAILGRSVGQIAAEKAAIIRPGGAVIMAPQLYPEAQAVIGAAASQAAVRVVEVCRVYAWQRLCHDLKGQTFRLAGPGGVLQLWLPLLGGHQIENAATAVACVEALPLAIASEAVAQGLAAVRWPGRLEVLACDPLVVADGAHNRDSARCLRESLAEYFAGCPVTLVMGTLSDKDIGGMASELAPAARRVIATSFDHPRAMAAARVAAAFSMAGCQVEVCPNLAEALDQAVARSPAHWLICSTGAIALAAAARRHILGAPQTV
jgi:dihydrofolate synthase/folylpolyglutamate synthase